MDSRNFAIGILSATAAILLVGILLLNAPPTPARASGMTANAGGYLLTVGMDASGDEELLYVIDVPSRRLIVYRFDGGRQRIEIVKGIDLAELRGTPGQPGKPGGRKPTPTRRRRP